MYQCLSTARHTALLHLTSCLDLVRSMLKQEFAAYIRSYQYISVIFEAIHEDRDPIVLSSLVLMIGILLQDTRALRDRATIRNLIPFLCMSLDMDMDPMATTPSARQEMAMFNDIKDAARQSGIIQKGQKVLIKSIALVNMIIIVNQGVSLQDKETLSVIENDPKFLGSVIEILIEDLAWIKQPSSGSNVSLPDVLDIDRVENCLGILERLALISNTPASMLTDKPSLFPLLVQLVTLCRVHALQNLQQAASLNLMLHILRLLINVTNGFERCGTHLANSGSIQVLVQNFVQFYHHCRNYCPEYPDLELDPSEPKWIKTSSRQVAFESLSLTKEVEIENDANGWYDMLLLSLGLLINILETSPHSRELITSTAIGLDCMAIGNCFHAECECEKSTETLERLVQIYNTEAIISDMTENQVLAAHLALLIGCVVEGSPENEDRLYRTIQGHSLEPMLELLREFVSIHKTVQDERYEPQHQEQVMMMEPSSTSVTMASSGTLAGKAAETEQSFVKVIQALQGIELRFQSRGQGDA
ncbi:MAG: hypothetical protein J3Q66DRAFT_15084 [Benniella sp.]|nr:MAG: hypothetical protein J3Q66DRAFT_15084 [Benniella sp.]